MILFNLSKIIPDKIFLKILYKKRIGRKLDFKYPKTFTEKLQWMKVYDRKPIYSVMVDKYNVKEYVSKKIEKKHVIPTLGIWDSFEDINFDLLPNQFVLKCTHDSASTVICKDKSDFSYDEARKIINKCLNRNYYWVGREWPYKNVKPRVLAEQLLQSSDNQDIKDYKFFCFNGKVKCFKIDFDRFSNHRANYYSKNLKLMNFGEKAFPPDFDRIVNIPDNIDKMIEIAEKLSYSFHFVRIDLYSVNNEIYFGEFTFYPTSGFGSFIPNDADEMLGGWMELK